MNFYAHALVAATTSSEPSFVLGAMLPDFARMARTRLPPFGDRSLEAGIEHHHRADDAFHGSTIFVGWCRRVREALEDLDVPRGPAMAVAHVGSELLLDGVLAREAIDSSFPAALAVAHEHLRGAPELSEVCRRVGASELPAAYVEPRFVAERLERILAPRPRLALPSRALSHVENALHEQLTVVEREHASLLDDVHRALGGRPQGTGRVPARLG